MTRRLLITYPQMYVFRGLHKARLCCTQASGHRHNEVLVTPPALQFDTLPIHEADPQEVVRLGFIGTVNPKEAKPTEDAQVSNMHVMPHDESFQSICWINFAVWQV